MNDYLQEFKPNCRHFAQNLVKVLLSSGIESQAFQDLYYTLVLDASHNKSLQREAFEYAAKEGFLT